MEQEFKTEKELIEISQNFLKQLAELALTQKWIPENTRLKFTVTVEIEPDKPS